MKIPTIKNMTHAAQIQKLFPASDLHLKMNQADDVQKDFMKKLTADKTKTDAERMRLHSQSGQKQLSSLIDATQNLMNGVKDRLESYRKRIGTMMEVRGTTDVVILNSTAQALVTAGFKPTQLYTMAREEPEIARAVLLAPALKYGLKMEPEMKDAFKTLVAQQTLQGDYKDYELAQKQDEVLSNIGEWFMDGFKTYSNNITEVESGRVQGIPDVAA